MTPEELNRIDFDDFDPKEDSDGHEPHPDRPTRRLQGDADSDS